MANIKKIKLPNGTEYDIKDSGALPLTGGTVTGPVIFEDSTSMNEATIGDLVVNGNGSFTNNIQANTINGVTVGTTPKFTDTVTTATTTGSGNAVTAITASNGALTVTKGATFLTSHQDISGKADKSATVSTVAYDSTNKKITKTINGTTTDVVTVTTLKSALGSMPASDVYSWAKASTKPTYTASEVGAQPTLVSGTNIKTINNQSILGSGDISIDESYFIDIDKWVSQTATSQDYADIEDAIQTGKYLYIGQEDEQSGEIFHNPVTCSGITEDSEIICYYIEDDTVHMYTFHSDGTYYYEYHYLQRKLTAGNGIEIYSNNVISATGLSSATNWLNGSQPGSVRTNGSREEASEYTIGQNAVAEGQETVASGIASHAEGANTTANGYDSHAEGYLTVANGSSCHVEGSQSIANGYYTHAEGHGTIASGISSHAQGTFNIEDPSAYTKTTDTSVDSSKTYYTLSNEKFSEVSSPTTSGLPDYYEYRPGAAQQAFIIGNGASDSNRSNALTVDWDGNLDIAGNLQIGDSAWINKVVDIDSTVAPSSDIWRSAIQIKDKNDLSLGYLEGAVLSSGYNGLTLTARRDISGTNKYNGVRLLIDSSGNPVTQFNSPSAWRQGLGLSLSSVQNIASYITSTKGTFVSGQIVTYDRIAQLIIRFRNTSAVGSGGNIYEGKLTKWHPVSLNGSGVNGIGYFGASALVGYINSGGDIIVRNASNSSVTINSSSNAYVTFTYLMGANQ